MARKTMILKESTKENKIRRLTKHLTKRNHKTKEFCQINDEDAVKALAKLGYKIEIEGTGVVHLNKFWRDYKLVSC